MTRIVAISDTHGFYNRITIPDGDILVHAGDITGQGTFECLEEFNSWLSGLPHKHKVVIAGNHDWCFQWDQDRCRTILSNATYLQDEGAEIEGLKFYGSPWQPRFFDWAFNLDRGAALAEKWDMIPNDTDILVTHGPAFGILDEVANNNYVRNVGCQDLLIALQRIKPKVHIFGHIHEGYGEAVKNGTLFLNASVNTSRYQPTNPPIVIDI